MQVHEEVEPGAGGQLRTWPLVAAALMSVVAAVPSPSESP